MAKKKKEENNQSEEIKEEKQGKGSFSFRHIGGDSKKQNYEGSALIDNEEVRFKCKDGIIKTDNSKLAEVLGNNKSLQSI